MIEKDMSGFRPAKGNKFETVIDSYMYLLALVGTRTDEYTEHETERWMCLLTSDDLVADLGVLANRRGLRIDHLELTEDEFIELNTTAAVVIIESAEGLVEVNYFYSFDEAYALFDDLYTDGVNLMDATWKRLKKRPKRRLSLVKLPTKEKKQAKSKPIKSRGESPRRENGQYGGAKMPEVRDPLIAVGIPRGKDLNETLFEDIFPRSTT